MTNRFGWTLGGAWLCLALVACADAPASPPDGSTGDAGDATDVPVDSRTEDDAAPDTTDCDRDGDSFLSVECGGNDCDDSDIHRYPGNVELCDGMLPDGRSAAHHDEDCDSTTLGLDDDHDGFDDTACCNPTDSGEVCGTDCDDALAGVNPSAADGCGGGDEDCDGAIDEEPDSTYFRDEDNDTYGDDSDTLESCSLPRGYSARGGDCADNPGTEPLAAQINPGFVELCDGLDNDCDMIIDNRVDSGGAPLACGCDTPGASRSCGSDVGTCTVGVQRCTSGAWTECNGTSAIPETCDDLDNDCDRSVDEDATDRPVVYRDVDDDGFGDSSASDRLCPIGGSPPTGWADRGGDCVDGDDTIFPGATERPGDEVDQNCDGREVCFRDDDADSYRTTTTVASSDSDCRDYREAHSGQGIDCNDSNNSIHPLATENVGNEIDENCDGRELCYTDRDGDDFRTDEVRMSSDVDCNDASEARVGVLTEFRGFPAHNCCDRDQDMNRSQSWRTASEDIAGNTFCPVGRRFDWDCDGNETRRYTERIANTNQCTGWPSCAPTGHSSGWAGTVPSCGGVARTWLANCHTNGFDCVWDVSTRDQQCY